MSNNKSARFEELRKRAEDLISAGELSGDKLSDISLSFDELIHELEVHQIELEMQHTELQESHRRLEASRRHYIDLFDFAPIGYVITDERGYIRNTNLTLSAMFGLSRTQIEGRSLAKFIHEDDIDIYYLGRQSVFDTGQSHTCEVRIQLANDHGFVARLDSIYIANQDECRVAVTDVTQQKRAEQSTKVALQREQELNQLKSRLLNMITHEFRTPLSIILSSIDTLERYNTELSVERRAERFQRVRDFVWHMNRMITEVATAYRAEEDDIQVRPELTNGITLFTDLSNDINRIYDDRLHLDIKQVDNEDSTIECDRTLFTQILINLIMNAIKFSDNAVTVTLDLHPDNFIVKVADTGIGIPEEEQQYIFDTFFRAKNAETLNGTGIGLSIVKRITTACRGTIEVQSEINQGTTFTLRFPRYWID